MTEFREAFFTSELAAVSSRICKWRPRAAAGRLNAATRHFIKAAKGDDVSAYHNLSLIWGEAS